MKFFGSLIEDKKHTILTQDGSQNVAGYGAKRHTGKGKTLDRSWGIAQNQNGVGA